MNPRIHVKLFDGRGDVVSEACYDIRPENEVYLKIEEPAVFNEADAGIMAERILKQISHRRDFLTRATAECGKLIADNLTKQNGFKGDWRGRLIQQVQAWKFIGVNR